MAQPLSFLDPLFARSAKERPAIQPISSRTIQKTPILLVGPQLLKKGRKGRNKEGDASVPPREVRSE